MRLIPALALLPTMGLAIACTPRASRDVAATIYTGGPIVTVNEAQPTASAIAVKDGKILAVGGDEILQLKGAATQVVDLAGKTMLPGFIDAHGHVFNVGVQAVAANLLAPPDGEVTDIASLQATLRTWAEKSPAVVARTGWIIGMGYDDSQLGEQRHPTRDDLDAVSTVTPVLVVHQSGHLAVLNSKGLEAVGYSAETVEPPGGRSAAGPAAVSRTASSEARHGGRSCSASSAGSAARTTRRFCWPASIATPSSASPPPRKGAPPKRRSPPKPSLPAKASSRWMSSRIPTSRGPRLRLPGRSCRRATPGASASVGPSSRWTALPRARPRGSLKPYRVPPAGRGKDYAGSPAMTDEQANGFVDEAFKNGWQIHVHCNGDAAADQFIRAVRLATAKYGPGDRRPVMIHAQTVREDQLDAMKELGIIPSFFGMHTYYWGDWHRDSVLGPERASRISPAASALKRGMPFTQHHDAPVALPSSIMILFSQVNRVTRSGQVLGPEQRVSAMDAIKSTTINAAYQYFEERTKGSLEPGKLADFVILDRNPLTVDPMAIKDIKVVETIKEGRTIYRAQPLVAR